MDAITRAKLYIISIHAPRVGSDPLMYPPRLRMLDFYPRSPRGERQLCFSAEFVLHDFYPRSPRGERRAR